jgi:hypothetical protein
MLHQLGYRVMPIPDTLLQLGCDQSNSLGLVKLQPARKAFLSQKAGLYV